MPQALTLKKNLVNSGLLIETVGRGNLTDCFLKPNNMTEEKKEVYARYGMTDLVVLASQDVPKYLEAEGHCVEVSLIGYEYEDGIECEEDGTPV